MERYIEREKFLKKCAEAWGYAGVTIKAIEQIADECTTADVVPKSEVDRLNAVMKDMDDQRAYTINMLGENLENAKAEVQRLQAENKKLTIKMNAYGLTAKRLKEDVDRLQEINNNQVENIRLAKQEVAREIFGEIKYNFEDLRKVEYANPPLQVVFNLLDYLEKKYTEEKT